MTENLKVALEAVKKAEEAILRYYEPDVGVDTKADQSPVTIADRTAEETIISTIKAKFPDHTFFGEEGEKADLNNHKGYTWIIDPIDGTKAYIRNNPIFATQLALMHDGELILGVSNAPKLQELVYAEKGQGCYFNGERMRVSGTGNLADAYMSHGSLKYFEKTGKTKQLVNIANSVKQSRGYSDFWPYHFLVQDRLDIMIEADNKLWDIAAQKVIIEEAGGRLTQVDGSEIDHSSTSAVATNGLLHDEVIKMLNGV